MVCSKLIPRPITIKLKYFISAQYLLFEMNRKDCFLPGGSIVALIMPLAYCPGSGILLSLEPHFLLIITSPILLLHSPVTLLCTHLFINPDIHLPALHCYIVGTLLPDCPARETLY